MKGRTEEVPSTGVPNAAILSVRTFNPLTDPSWREQGDSHPLGTVFHSRGWLEALSRTYGFEPVGVTSSDSEEPISGGIVFCRCSSRLTGRRLVGLPFSDHADPLVGSGEELAALLRALASSFPGAGYRYTELRPLSFDEASWPAESGFRVCSRFLYHEIDLGVGAGAVWDGLHRDCIRRKVRRAEREGVVYREGAKDAALINDYYWLHQLTRRRQGVPPQPFAWFRNLAECLPESVRFRVAYHGSRPVAGIVTLAFRDRLVYKYGASDERFNALGGTPLLFWRAIEAACEQGMRVFDLGRCDLDNRGLATFKERLGGRPRELVYFRDRCVTDGGPGLVGSPALRRIVSRCPLPLLRLAGSVLYRHFG